MKLAIVGITGLVGREILEVLDELKVDISTLIPVASPSSVGKKITFRHQEWTILSAQDAVNAKPDIAIFSAGSGPSKEWAPKFAAVGTYVVDNSSCWRMDPDVPLVVPEINANSISESTKIIANPNCSTIQLVMALAPLHKAFNIKRLVISTYQSFTGTGKNAVEQYETEKSGGSLNGKSAYPHPIFENCIPHCDVFFDNGYTKEELKLVNETQKILNDNSIKVTATAVRVPVFGGHSEAVNIEFDKEYSVEQVKDILESTDGVTVLDDINNNIYPMPLMANKKNDVFVGRIRRDETISNGLNVWIVSDNLRKGAATNAVQVAQHIIAAKLVLN